MTDLCEQAEQSGGLYMNNAESRELLEVLQEYDNSRKVFEADYTAKVNALRDILTCKRIDRDKLGELIDALPGDCEMPMFDWQDTLLHGLTYATCKADVEYIKWQQRKGTR